MSQYGFTAAKYTAMIPVGEKQHRVTRTAGAIQLLGGPGAGPGAVPRPLRLTRTGDLNSHTDTIWPAPRRERRQIVLLGRKVSSNIDREAGTALWRRTRMRSSAQPPSEATDERKTNASADPADTPVAAVELRGFEGHLAVICRQTRTAVSNLNCIHWSSTATTDNTTTPPLGVTRNALAQRLSMICRIRVGSVLPAIEGEDSSPAGIQRPRYDFRHAHVCRGIGDVGEVDVNRGDREVNGIEAGKVERSATRRSNRSASDCTIAPFAATSDAGMIPSEIASAYPRIAVRGVRSSWKSRAGTPAGVLR